MLSIETPLVLLCLPLPLLVYFFMPKAAKQFGYAIKLPFYENLMHLKQHQASSRQTLKKLALPLLIWTLLVLAASNPVWLGKPITIPQSGRNIILALDLSGSMQTPDMKLHGQYYNRLAVVKYAARQFITARQGDRLGLILFGSRAYLQTPLTFDHKTLLQMLDDASIGLAGTQTAIGDAIGLAIKRLQKVPGKSKVLVLLTDGANNAGSVAPMDAADMAKKAGIKIFTIGIGANQMVVPGLFGPQVIHPTNDLDETALKQIAERTGGLFFRAEDGKSLEKVYQSINKLVPVRGGDKQLRPQAPLYPWLLGIALCLFFITWLSSSPWHLFPTQSTRKAHD